MEFTKALETRRSIHSLTNEMLLPDDQVADLVGHAVQHTPSAFDSQSQRAILLFGKKHLQLWSIVLEGLRKVVPAADFPKSEKKIQGFANGRGTVLYFDDTAVLEGLVKSYPLYEKNFRLWAEQQIL
ncbi:MAG: nitroreductase family protein, partial [Bacillota bacterium]|nr:nitroreductase family protein [Bacillota bacterium]